MGSHDISVHCHGAACNDLRIAASVFNHTDEGIVITDMNGNIMRVNDAFTQITGYSREELIGKNPHLLESGKHDKTFFAEIWQELLTIGTWQGDIWNRRKNGELYQQLTKIIRVHNTIAGWQDYFIGLIKDVTYQRANEATMKQLAFYDPLTDLPNRRLFGEKLQSAIVSAHDEGKILAICYIDLDEFKNVNDNYGHHAGDALLCEIARRLAASLPHGDIVARLGGDEFAMIVHGNSANECGNMIHRIIDVISLPCAITAKTGVKSDSMVYVSLSASIGATLYPDDRGDAEILVRHANYAMHVAKQQGRNQFHFFNTLSDQAIHAHHEMVLEIKRAIANRDFVLFFQPKVDMLSGEIVGAEALVRWLKDDKIVPPSAFLPIVEESPLLDIFGMMVLELAFQQAEIWVSKGVRIPLSINVFAQQLAQKHFPKLIESLLLAHPTVSPDLIELEIVETQDVGDFESTNKIIQACCDLGVGFSIDDFGTGYSSLKYLKHLPVDTLKIDQSFVRDISNNDNQSIVEAILNLAHAFKNKTIAEGVESDQHGTELIRIGCRYAQGYAIGKPMPAKEFEVWRKKWQRPSAWVI
jgi:diguanylate cyclase (GGDEF)-like protein/PAS domain S-box-containing protein